MTTSFKTDVGVALGTAIDVLKAFSPTDIEELSPADRIAFAHAEATMAIAQSLLKIAALKQEQADVRAFRGN